MLSDAIRRRLEQLNRAPLDRAPLQRAAAELVTPGSDIRAPLSPSAAAGNQLALFPPGDSRSVGGRPEAVEFANDNGLHLRLRRPLTTFFPRGVLGLPSGEPGKMGPEGPASGAAPHPEIVALAEHFPRGTMYLDLETCGFAGSMIFLVGLVWHDKGELWLDQLLARNYAEEHAMLTTLWQIAATMRVLVTFNGKSFDWPMVKDRSTLHRLSRDELSLNALLHCDLLHHARRRWRGRLPDCRLQTLERSICRRQRSGDVPGALVPGIYHAYVRSGDLRVIEPVLHHNALDLVTLVQIGQALLPRAQSVAQSA